MKTPKLSLKRVSTLPTRKSEGKPALKVCGGSNSTLGNMNRLVATAPAAQAAANEVHATPRVDRKPRRVTEAGVPFVWAAVGRPGGAGAAGAPGAGAGDAAVCRALAAASEA